MKQVLYLSVATLAIFGTLIGCGKSKPVCEDAEIVDGCKIKCRRVVEKADAVEYCSSQLVLSAPKKNSILASDIKKVQTKRLGSEVCYQVVAGKITDMAVQQRLQKACGVQAGPASAPAKGY